MTKKTQIKEQKTTSKNFALQEETKQLTIALHQHASSRFFLQRHSAK